MRIKALLLLPALLAALPSLARDFEYTYEGQTLTYTVIDEAAKTVAAYKNGDMSGELIIPEKVKDGNVDFTVTSIGERAFFRCSGLTSVTISNSVTSIGGWAFYECSGLTSITIPNSVTSIGENTFFGCSSLTEVTIGNSVTEISSSVFDGCGALTSIVVESQNSNYSSIDGVLFNKDASVLLLCPDGKTGNYVIPNSVTSIVNRAFANCDGLTSVTIGNSVTTIGGYAFSGCMSLPSMIIPNSVTEIGNGAFENCSGLTEVTISNSVTSIGGWTFYECSGLTSVTIPNSVTELGEGAFAYCSGLTSVTIPNSVTSIGSEAFTYCTGLTSVTIPNSVTETGESAFENCSGLTEVTIPNSIKEIAPRTFEDCSSLVSVEIPESVTKIRYCAFHDCDALASIAIPASVTEIEGDAFSRSGLTSVYSYSTVPPTLGEDVFYEIPSTIPVFVPAGSVDAYRNAEGWNYFTDFREMGGEVVELAVTLSETALELKEGKTATLTATITKPEDVTVTAEEWTSSDEAVATVDSGTVTAVAEGKATITYTATFSNGETRTATCEVTVIKQSGIEAISSEAEDDAEYFTLQGIRVKADKLAPGVYIRRSVDRTDKVLVK